MSDKEKRGIYNVTFNEKKSTSIDTDLEIIENAIIDYVVHYVKGYHDNRRDKGLGAEHIKLHLEPNSEGQISLEELLNLGNSIREYLKNFKEPFIDENGAKIYEWENKEKIRFRVVTDRINENNLKKITEEYQRGGRQLPLSPFDEQIITFYSDRNLNQQMEFKNPKVKEYYENKLLIDNKSPKSPFFSKMKNSLCKVKEGLNRGKEKINNDESYLNSESLKNLDKDTNYESLKDDKNKQDNNSNPQNPNKTLRKKR